MTPETANQASTTRQGDEASPPVRKVLRILNGPQTTAESEISVERILVGNIESECDIVVDVGSPERHACLLRLSNDGWTALAIAGDLWVANKHIKLQHSRPLKPASVLTLGRVAFTVADPEAVDWSKIKPTPELLRPEKSGPIPAVTLATSKPSSMRRWRAVRLGSGIGVAALVMASASAFLTEAWNLRAVPADAAALKLAAAQKMVHALPFGKELALLPSSDEPRRTLVQGFVPTRAQVAELERALQLAHIEPDLRLAAVDELSNDLGRRFAASQAAVRYEGDGGFTIIATSEFLESHDRQARMALQELPHLKALHLSEEDVFSDDGKPIRVRYERSAIRPGDIQVTDLDTMRMRQRFDVREVRLGPLPSIVLSNGVRYFEGAVLPDSSVLMRIQEQALVLQRGRGEKTVPLGTTTAPAAAALPGAPAAGLQKTVANSAQSGTQQN